MQNTEAIITYWVEGFRSLSRSTCPQCCLEIQNESWSNSLENLWVLEQQLAWNPVKLQVLIHQPLSR